MTVPVPAFEGMTERNEKKMRKDEYYKTSESSNA